MLYQSVDELLWLDQIQPRDRSQVGSLAFYLSRLQFQGYPVLPGFTIPASTLGQFLETIHWLDPLFADLPNSSLHLDVDNARQLQLVAKAIRQEITKTALPVKWQSIISSIADQLQSPTLILRPSLALPSRQGWKIAGLLDAHVCDRASDSIEKALKRVWAELFRAKSLLYWRRKGIQLDQINLAVLVQPLLGSLASGVAIANSSTWEIQATYGLGMAILKGEVLPDYYQVQPETGTVLMQQLGIKTLAYNVGELPGAMRLDSNNGVGLPLQAFLLSEEQQQQYALEDRYLKELIQLAQQLATEIGSNFTLDWTIAASPEEHSTDRLYITQIRTEQEVGGGEWERGNRDAETQFAVGEQEKINLYPPLSLPIPSPSESQINAHPDAAEFSHLPVSVSSSENLNKQDDPVLRGLGASGGRASARAFAIDNQLVQNLEIIPSGRVLVVKTIHPDWLPLLKRSAAVVAEQGGMTCHAAIITRELGIPAVVGVPNATNIFQSGCSLLVDGDRGEICILDDEAVVFSDKAIENSKSAMDSASPEQHRMQPQNATQGYEAEHPEQRYLPTSNFAHPTATQLMVNLSQPSTIERAARLPVDGVGLLRSELMILELLEGQHPSRWLTLGRRQELIELLAQAVCRFTRAFAPRPVFYRSLDWRSHEFQSLTPLVSPEVNPMLGMRGTFSYMQDASLFDIELAALLKVYQSGCTNIHLLLPFVRTVEEFSFCRRRVEQCGLLALQNFQLWIMAEVPSVLFLLPDYVKAGVQGISIGTNDLTQLLLGVDRDRAEMASAFDERHPAVMRAIAQLIQAAKKAGIPCSICGQAPAQYPELIDSLVRWGITSISVSLDAFDTTYSSIARAEQRLLLEAARQQLVRGNER